jgi:hypothetical protein
MITPKQMWTSAAALVLAGALPAFASAQGVPDPHAGHHPAEAAAPATPPPPAPSTTPAKPNGMISGEPGMGGGMGTMKDMGGSGGKPMMGMMGGGVMPMGADVEGRIASLKTELKITDPQAGAWNMFADVLRANAKRAGQVHAAMMTAPNAAPLTLPQRLERHERMLAVGLDNLQAMKPALVRLYAGLSAEQKSSADRLLAHETGTMPGMQMGGMPMSDMSGGMKKQ